MTAFHRNLLIAGLLVLCGEFVLLGPFSILTTHDNGEITVPNLVAFNFLPRDVFYWYPFSTGGVDRLSIGSLSPLDVLLFRYLPGWLAYQSGMIAQIGCAVFGVFMLSQRVMGLSTMPSIFAALAYGFFIGAEGKMFMAVLSYLPFFIYCLGQTLDNKKSLSYWGVLALSLALLSLTGHMGFFFPFAQMLGGLWFIFLDRRRAIADWLIICGVFGLSVAIRLQDIVALVKVAPISQRLYVEKPQGWDAIEMTWNQITHHFFGNPSALLFLALALIGFCFRPTSAMQRRALCAWLFGIAGVFAFSALKPALASVLPFIKGYNLDRFAGYLSIFVILLAAAGMEAWLKCLAPRDGRPRQFLRWRAESVMSITVILALIASALPIKYINYWEWITHGTFAHTQQSEPIRELAKRIHKEPMPVRAESFQMYPSYLHAYGIETAGGYLSLIMKRYHSFWMKVIEPSLTKDPDTVMSQTAITNGQRLILNTERHLADVPFASLFNLDLLSLANVKYFVSRDRLTHPDLTAIREMPKAWNELTTHEKVKTNLRANFFGRGQIFIYENKKVLPRFFLAAKYQALETDAEILRRIGAEPASVLRHTVFLNSRDLPEGMPAALTPGGEGNVVLKTYSPDEIVLEIDSLAPRILFTAISFNPAWCAYVDGAPVALFPADHAFMGLLVPGGRHRVVLRYEPSYKFSNPLL